MFALFLVIAATFTLQGKELSALTRVWCIVTLVSSVTALVVGRKTIKNMLAECRVFWQKKNYLLVLVTVISVVISIGFTRPATEDITVLIVDAAIETDSMYLVNPYSGYETGMIERSQALSPIEMLYATGVQLTQADTQMVIYYMLPVTLLIFFFLAIWRVSGTFFEQIEQRIWFEVVVIAIYWMTAYMKDRTLLTGIFLNSWNGITILSCIIFPLAFSMMIQWMRQAEHGIKKFSTKLEIVLLSMILVLAAQLTNNKGGFYILLMLFLTIAVIVVKGGYPYVIKTGRIKKRI